MIKLGEHEQVESNPALRGMETLEEIGIWRALRRQGNLSAQKPASEFLPREWAELPDIHFGPYILRWRNGHSDLTLI